MIPNEHLNLGRTHLAADQTAASWADSHRRTCEEPPSAAPVPNDRFGLVAQRL
jgi:hypothetical protein